MRHILPTLAGLVFTAPLFATISVQLTPSLVSPQPVGTPVSFTATATETGNTSFDYQFAVSYHGLPMSVIQDYDISNVLTFAPYLYDGDYTVQVTARDTTTKSTAVTSATYIYSSRVKNNAPVASASSNPLVGLYSTPGCPAGGTIYVRFSLGGQNQVTESQNCSPHTSMNFYIAGMLAKQTYTLTQFVTVNGKTTQGPPVKFTTGAIPAGIPFPAFSVPVTPAASIAKSQSILLLDPIGNATSFYTPTAVDLKGDVVWYYAGEANSEQAGTYYIRPLDNSNGNMLVILKENGTHYIEGQIIREIDLAGNTVRQTDVTRVNEQLANMGHTIGVTAFDHDAIRLPNGHTLVIGSQEEIYPTGTQGSTGPVDIIGDSIVDLDQNLQVAWFWSGYDHLDINRKAILGETCTNGQGGCPPVTLAPIGNDWLHANSLNYVPSTGDVLISLRHQDWVTRVDYKNGTGAGDVVWQLGLDGNFTINSSDAYPWFSHQHDVEYELGGTTLLSIFDNGNTRVSLFPGEHSRGYVLSVDEPNFMVTPTLLADLGVYAVAVGSAQRLNNGDYHFNAGLLAGASYALSTEVQPNATINYQFEDNTTTYRSYRMVSMYELDGPQQ